jgi:microcystin-dependent protein
MAEPFMSEIRIFSFNHAPKSWAMCNGQLLPINQNQPLFALLGTTFGGNGQTNFALPDLRGRTPIHVGSGHTLGEKAGEQSHTLSTSELPEHVHMINASENTAATNIPDGNVLANSNPNNIYGVPANLQALKPESITNVGGSQAHTNMMPYLTLTFCIALQGIFPSPN